MQQSENTKTRLAMGLLVGASVAMGCAQLQAQTLPGHARMELQAPHRDGATVRASMWYPAAASGGTVVNVGGNLLFHGREAQQGADLSPSAERRPLVVVSHGSGGNMDALSWLGAGLADAGAIVAMVNHPGSTSGDSVQLRSVHLDERARDIHMLLDHVLADPQIGAQIDPTRIAALGFSMGGGTVMQLAGAQFERARYTEYCARYGDAAQDCRWLEAGGVDLTDLPEGMESDLTDPRITHLLAIDPAFGHAWRPDSLTAMDMPALVINLGPTGPGSGWEAVGSGPDGADLGAQMPDMRYEVIEDAWHFSFLAECRLLGPLLIWWEGEDAICSNPWGSDRAEVHEILLNSFSAALGLSSAS